MLLTHRVDDEVGVVEPAAGGMVTDASGPTRGATIDAVTDAVTDAALDAALDAAPDAIGGAPLRVEIYRRDPRAVMPVYKTTGAAAFDLSALDAVTIAPGDAVRVTTGLVIRVPEGYFLGVFARSGTASRGLALGNGVGVIDCDYCGPDDELRVLVRNFRPEPMAIEAGERIAQAIVLPCPRATLVEVARPAAPNRGGFGSTGQ